MYERCKTIEQYLAAQNLRADFTNAASENCWMGKLTNDLAHWAECGIFTLDQLGDYLDACARPSLADEFYYYQEEFAEHQRQLAEEEERETERVKAQYVTEAAAPATHNPFAALATMMKGQ